MQLTNSRLIGSSCNLKVIYSDTNRLYKLCKKWTLILLLETIKLRNKRSNTMLKLLNMALLKLIITIITFHHRINFSDYTKNLAIIMKLWLSLV